MNVNRPGGNTPPGNPPRPPRLLPPPLPALAPAAPSTPPLPEAHAANPRRRPGSPLQNNRRGAARTLHDPDKRDIHGMSALHRAIRDNNRAVMMRLLHAGANPNLLLPYRMTPLMFAARHGHADAVHVLLGIRAIHLATLDSGGANALHHAACAGSAEVVRMLLDAGVDPQAARSDGCTALHVAASADHPDAVVALMQAMPGPWNSFDSNGHTALHLAAGAGNVSVVAAMAEQPGFDINQMTQSGYTALHMAAFQGFLPVVNAILDAPGVDVNAHTEYKKTALQTAVEKGHADIVAALAGAPGIELNRMQDGADAALHIAVRQNDLDVLDILLATPGIDVNLAERSGFTPLMLCSAFSDSPMKEEAALRLLDHPGIDPNGAILLLSSSHRVLDYFRRKAGVPASMSHQDFEMQELERWTRFVPSTGMPNRWLTSMTNFRLGVLLHSSRLERPTPPAGARRDLNLKDAAFHLTLALEQSLQFHDGFSLHACNYARWLLELVPPEPDADPTKPDHYHNQFLIGGIAVSRSEIEDMAQVRGHYAIQGEMINITHHGWQANVHQPGFLLRGRDILLRLQERDVAGLPLDAAVAAVRHSIDALAVDATASQWIQTALDSVEPEHAQAQAVQPLSDAAKLAMANTIACQPEPLRAALQRAWRTRLMHAGLQQTLSQGGEVNEEGLMTTAPETLRLLQSYIQWQSHQPGRQALAGQLQDALLERLHDIGAEPRVCNTGCVQRLLDAPAGIDNTLMAREPHDRAIFDEILRIGSIVNQAFDDQFDEGDQGIVHESDQQNHDELSGIVRKDILRATTIDDLVRRRGWDRPKVQAQLDAILDAL